MNSLLIRIVDLFYLKPLRFIPRETFRYGAVGGLNLLFGSVLYWFIFNFPMGNWWGDASEKVYFGIVTAPILAFLITFAITFFTGFYLVRTVAFGTSQVRGRRQLFRYAQVVAVNLLINYAGLHLLIKVWDFYPTLSYVMIQLVTVIFSYVAQRFYTFKTHRP